MAAVAKRGHGGGKGAHSTAQMFREMERQGARRETVELKDNNCTRPLKLSGADGDL